jgi:hypothetical protein
MGWQRRGKKNYELLDPRRSSMVAGFTIRPAAPCFASPRKNM